MIADVLSELQCRVISKVVEGSLIGEDRIVAMRSEQTYPRKPRKPSSYVMGNNIIRVSGGQEVKVESVHGRVIGNLVELGLLKGVHRKDLHQGKFYKATKFAIDNATQFIEQLETFDKPVLASWDWLEATAKKWGCEIDYSSLSKSFKIKRLDGLEFKDPYITQTNEGAPVYKLRDMSRQEWEEVIIHKIQHETIEP